MSEEDFDIIWFPKYIGDFTTATTHLSTEQIGAYELLLMKYYRKKGPLPDDDNQLAAITKLSLNQWRKHRPTIEEFFTIKGGKWINKRADLEIAGIIDRHNTAVAKGKTGMESRWRKR